MVSKTSTPPPPAGGGAGGGAGGRTESTTTPSPSPPALSRDLRSMSTQASRQAVARPSSHLRSSSDEGIAGVSSGVSLTLKICGTGRDGKLDLDVSIFQRDVVKEVELGF